MPISPRRRRRILHAHRLREGGWSLREIAAELDISHTTVHQDLKLLETHWAEFAQALANDSLIEHHCRLRDQLERLYNQHPLDAVHGFHDGMALIEFPPAQLVQLVALHKREIIAAMREYRYSINDLRKAAEAQRDTPQPVPDYPDDELTPPEPPEQTQPNPTEIDHPHQPPPPPEPVLIPVFTSPPSNSETDAVPPTSSPDQQDPSQPEAAPSQMFSPRLRGEMPQAEGGVPPTAPPTSSPDQQDPSQPEAAPSRMFSPRLRGEMPQAEGGVPPTAPPTASPPQEEIPQPEAAPSQMFSPRLRGEMPQAEGGVPPTAPPTASPPQEEIPQPESAPSPMFSPRLRGEMPQAEGGVPPTAPPTASPPQEEIPQPESAPSQMFSPRSRGEMPQAEGGRLAAPPTTSPQEDPPQPEAAAPPIPADDLPAFPTHAELNAMDLPQLAQYFQLLKAAAPDLTIEAGIWTDDPEEPEPQLDAPAAG